MLLPYARDTQLSAVQHPFRLTRLTPSTALMRYDGWNGRQGRYAAKVAAAPHTRPWSASLWLQPDESLLMCVAYTTTGPKSC